MHEERDEDGFIITVADPGDFICPGTCCDNIIRQEDAVECDVCQKKRCPDCIATKKGMDYEVCRDCLDVIVNHYIDPLTRLAGQAAKTGSIEDLRKYLKARRQR